MLWLGWCTVSEIWEVNNMNINGTIRRQIGCGHLEHRNGNDWVLFVERGWDFTWEDLERVIIFCEMLKYVKKMEVLELWEWCNSNFGGTSYGQDCLNPSLAWRKWTSRKMHDDKWLAGHFQKERSDKFVDSICVVCLPWVASIAWQKNLYLCIGCGASDGLRIPTFGILWVKWN